MSGGDLKARLEAVLDERYHHRHPFNLRMHEGQLSREEIRTWVRNRYYYQTRIPIKDGLILAKAQDPAFRREWVRRIHDHDGDDAGQGGLALWLALADAVGLDVASVERLEGVLPGVRRACDAYVEFVRTSDLLEAVAASLTESRAGALMRARSDAWRAHYPWVDPDGLRYFETRTTQAPTDAEQGFRFVLEHAETEEQRGRCVAALTRKCEILWSLLDAVVAAHAKPALTGRAQLRESAGESLVVLPERAVRLNESGVEILSLCDGKATAEAVAAELRRRHADIPDLEGDVYRFIEEMLRLGVLESRGPAT